MGGGFPIGAVLASERAVEFFVPGDHGCTFGGNPLACACGNAVMKALIDEDLLSHVDEMSAYLFRGLTQLKEKYDLIEEVRGMGLLIGVELEMSDEKAKAVWLELMYRGFILNLTYGPTLRLLPPLTIDEADLEAFTETLEDVLRRMA